MTVARAETRLRGRLPLTAAQREAIVLGGLAALALAVIGLWWADTPAGSLHTFADRLTAAGRITGLVGTYLVLVQVLLMARLPWLDRWVGTDRLSAWHRSNGAYTIVLLVAHTVLITWGYASLDKISPAHELRTLLRSYPDVLAATVALIMLIGVGLSSVRFLRRRLMHETWYFVHLYTYLAIALAFSHELATGNEFITHRANRILWVAMYVVTFGLLVVFRVVAPIRDALRYQLRVESVEPEAGGAVSVYVGGIGLDRMEVEAGQFFRWRFLTRESWWHSHPFSLSAPPTGKVLRLTAKAVGSHTTELARLRPGTRVVAEGPYGNLTGRRRTRQKVLLLAGGVGITPLRSLLGALPAAPGDLVLLYRVSRDDEVMFRSELEELATNRGAIVRYLIGRRDKHPGPLSAPRLRHHVPDIIERDVFLCGPPGMMAEATASLRSLGLRRSQIHAERFEL